VLVILGTTSIKSIAHAIKRDRTTVSKILHGRVRVSMETLEKIASLLQAPTAVLIKKISDDTTWAQRLVEIFMQSGEAGANDAFSERMTYACAV
jgi:transcriptional regulator with XRE-family HTH domain